MSEIAENLHRRNLDDLERAELVAAWVEAVRERNKLAHDEPVSKRGNVEGRGNKGGVRQAARDLGMNRDTISRHLRVASLSPEAKAAARKTGVKEQSFELVAAWVEAVRERNKKVGHDGQPPGGKQPNDKGVSQASRDLGMPRKTVERHLRVVCYT